MTIAGNRDGGSIKMNKDKFGEAKQSSRALKFKLTSNEFNKTFRDLCVVCKNWQGGTRMFVMLPVHQVL